MHNATICDIVYIISTEKLPGQDVWVTDQRPAEAVIGSYTTPCSYLVDGPHGTIRQKGHHLIAMRPSPEQSSGGAAKHILGGVPDRPSTEHPAAALP